MKLTRQKPVEVVGVFTREAGRRFEDVSLPELQNHNGSMDRDVNGARKVLLRDCTLRATPLRSGVGPLLLAVCVFFVT